MREDLRFNRFNLGPGGGGAAPFIKQDGSVDLSVSSQVVDALPLGNILDHQIASGKTRQVGTGNAHENVAGSDALFWSTDPVTGGFGKAWSYMDNSSNFLGFGQAGGGNGTSIFVSDNGIGDGDFGLWINNAQSIWTSKRNIANFLSTRDTINTVISARSGTNGSGSFVNSVLIGGDWNGFAGINKSGYAFARNFEVQGGDFSHTGAAGKMGWFGTGPVIKQSIVGSRGGNAALADLLTKLANYGMITDSTSA